MKWRSSWVEVEIELGVELELGNLHADIQPLKVKDLADFERRFTIDRGQDLGRP